MTSGNLTAGDVLALTRNNEGFGFDGVGGFILLFIFLMALTNGNGFFGNNASTQLQLSDLQGSLYNQSTDSAIRGLAQGQCSIIDSALNNKYDNAILIKDLSNQMSNSVAALGNQIANQTATITNLFNQATIDHLREVNSNLHDSLSNQIQTAQITENILGNLATTAPKPPCYYGYGCGCNSLY